MELTGNAADRWQQISDKLGELALNISQKQKMVESISSTLDDLKKDLDTDKKALEEVSNIALKEVLREESGTLNDEPPVVARPIQAKEEPATQQPDEMSKENATEKEETEHVEINKTTKKTPKQPKDNKPPLLKVLQEEQKGQDD
jgi:hypothetical protein